MPLPKRYLASSIPGIIIGAALIIYGFLAFYPDFTFNLVVGGALVAGLTPISIVQHLDSRRRKLIDEALPRVLDDLAQSQETGMTLLQALEESAKRKYGPISEELRKSVVQVTWGVRFEEAFTSFAKRVGTELASRVAMLIVEAVRLGGDLKTTFAATAEFVRNVLALRRQRESEMKPFFLIIYVSTVVFLVTILILFQSFFVQIAAERGGIRFLKLPLTVEEFRGIIINMAYVEAFFGGLTAGKLSEGRIIAGLKHAVILLAMVTVVFAIFFQPTEIE